QIGDVRNVSFNDFTDSLRRGDRVDWLAERNGRVEDLPAANIVDDDMRSARHDGFRRIPMEPRKVHFRTENAAQGLKQNDLRLDFAIQIAGELVCSRKRLRFDRTVLLFRVLMDERPAHRQHGDRDRKAIENEPLCECGRQARSHLLRPKYEAWGRSNLSPWRP